MLNLGFALPLLTATALFGTSTTSSQDVLLHLRVTSNECEASAQCIKDCDVRLTVTGVGSDHHPVTIPVWTLGADQQKPGWKTFEIPRSTKLSVSVFAPPHPLLERVVEIGPAHIAESLELDLAPHVPPESPEVSVALPTGSPSWASRFHVNLLGPKSRNVLRTWRIDELHTGLSVPEGDYLFEARGIMTVFCGADPPDPEWFVPAQAKWRAGVLAPLTLSPERGSRLRLKVTPPRPVKESVGEDASGPRLGNIDLGVGLSCRPEDLVAIQLISLETGQAHSLTWGWTGIYFSPRSHFPTGKDVYQLVPVPLGEYELILRGVGIQELRRRVTLGPESTTSLSLAPKARGK